jgi:hypothetical protein
VLHRDLKPANVMLDGQGNVRITDFGLASLAETLSGDDVRSGTPGYMSPEQLLGREVTIRSDIYSLGLVLYELYTGRRAFEAKSLAEYTRKHRDERPIEPSALVVGLDPAVERAILGCLEKEPRRRPATPHVVSAMLTGSDPLEAALAAGETPSPELVAAAGESAGLRPAYAWSLLGLTLAGLAFVPLLSSSFRLLEKVPTGKAPAALEDRARDFIQRVAPQATPTDDGWGLGADWGYTGHIKEKDSSPDRWADLASGNPPVLSFWYRQSPRPLVSMQPNGKISWGKPALEISGMAGLQYDMEGRLLKFYAVPPQLEGEGKAAAAAPDWTPFFAEARLDPASFRSVEPRWTPALLRGHADGLGGIVAGAAGHPGAHRGGVPPRAAGLVRDRLAVDAARAHGDVPVAHRQGPAPGALPHARLPAARRRRFHGAAQPGAGPRRPPRRLPRVAAARGRSGSRRGRSARTTSPTGTRRSASWRAAPARSCSRPRPSGSSTWPSSPMRAVCVPGRSWPGPASLAGASRTRSSPATRSPASRGRSWSTT